MKVEQPLQCPTCNTPMTPAKEDSHVRCPNCGTYLNVVLVPILRERDEIDLDQLRIAGL